jgi:hypothetical protein
VLVTALFAQWSYGSTASAGAPAGQRPTASGCTSRAATRVFPGTVELGVHAHVTLTLAFHMRLLLSLATCCVGILAALAGIKLHDLVSASPNQPMQQPAPTSPCVLRTDKRVAPATLLLGERTQVTLTARTACPEDPMPLHVMLVIDTSASMRRQKLEGAKAWAREAVTALDLQHNGHVRVGLLGFHVQPAVVVELTNSADRVLAAIRDLDAAGGKAVDARSTGSGSARQADPRSPGPDIRRRPPFRTGACAGGNRARQSPGHTDGGGMRGQ